MKKLLICKIYRQLLACFLVVGTLHSPTASAGEIDYTIMPYLWTAGIDADIGRPGQTIPVDVSFSDYADLIDIGAAVYFEARGVRWSFISSLLWVKLSEDIQTPVSTIDAEVEQLLFEAAVGYQPSGWKETRVLAGIRYLDLITRINFVTLPDFRLGSDFADPFVGLEWRPRRGNWEFVAEADIGGGFDADFAWAFAVGGGYHFNDLIGASVTYRFLDIDFEDSEFVFDGNLNGVQLGLMFNF